MKNKVITIFLLASMVCSSSVIPTFAADGTDGKADPVIYQDITDKSVSKTAVTEVKASIKSKYTVTLPKTMTVNNGDNAYNVNVKGDWAGEEVISVVPDATVSLSSEGKNAVIGNITQEKQEFTYVDASKNTDGVLTGTDAAGNISINGLTAGHWTGTFNFNVGTKANNENMGEDVTLTSSNLSTYGIANTGDVIIPSVVTDSDGTKHKVTQIGNEVFRRCTSLTSITIPNGITSIGASAFESCNSLTSITIPNGITSIEEYTFLGCDNLTSITIPDSVTSIGNGAFGSCNGLTSITISNGITSIETCAFNGCTNLTKIKIPDSVTSIGDRAFNSCTELQSVTYKGTAYTNKIELMNALKANDVVANQDAFNGTALQ